MTKNIGPYQLVKEIGSGHSGKVFKVQHKETQRISALKYAQNEKQRIILSKESAILSLLNHPNIVQLEYGDPHGQFYVMSYIDGVHLHNNFLKKHNIDYMKFAELMQDLLKGLEHVHEQKIIHRDIKPENIIYDTNHKKLYLIDFGIAVRQQKAMEQSELKGSIHFMSPEQVKTQPLTPQTDIYSLGATIYYVLAEKHMYEANSTFELFEKIADPYIQPQMLTNIFPSTPTYLEAICFKALEKNVRKRYSSSQDFREDLERYTNYQIPLAPKKTISVMDKLRANILPLGATALLTSVLSIAGITSFYHQKNMEKLFVSLRHDTEQLNKEKNKIHQEQEKITLLDRYEQIKQGLNYTNPHPILKDKKQLDDFFKTIYAIEGETVSYSLTRLLALHYSIHAEKQDNYDEHINEMEKLIEQLSNHKDIDYYSSVKAFENSGYIDDTIRFSVFRNVKELNDLNKTLEKLTTFKAEKGFNNYLDAKEGIDKIDSLALREIKYELYGDLYLTMGNYIRNELAEMFQELMLKDKKNILRILSDLKVDNFHVNFHIQSSHFSKVLSDIYSDYYQYKANKMSKQDRYILKQILELEQQTRWHNVHSTRGPYNVKDYDENSILKNLKRKSKIDPYFSSTAISHLQTSFKLAKQILDKGENHQYELFCRSLELLANFCYACDELSKINYQRVATYKLEPSHIENKIVLSLIAENKSYISSNFESYSFEQLKKNNHLRTSHSTIKELVELLLYRNHYLPSCGLDKQEVLSHKLTNEHIVSYSAHSHLTLQSNNYFSPLKFSAQYYPIYKSIFNLTNYSKEESSLPLYKLISILCQVDYFKKNINYDHQTGNSQPIFDNEKFDEIYTLLNTTYPLDNISSATTPTQETYQAFSTYLRLHNCISQSAFKNKPNLKKYFKMLYSSKILLNYLEKEFGNNNTIQSNLVLDFIIFNQLSLSNSITNTLEKEMFSKDLTQLQISPLEEYKLLYYYFQRLNYLPTNEKYLLLNKTHNTWLTNWQSYATVPVVDPLKYVNPVFNEMRFFLANVNSIYNNPNLRAQYNVLNNNYNNLKKIIKLRAQEDMFNTNVIKYSLTVGGSIAPNGELNKDCAIIRVILR